MKKFFVFLLLIITFSLFSLNLTLKESVNLNKNFCTFYDIVNENEKYSYSNFMVLENINRNCSIITSDEILKILFKNDINNVTLVGDQVTVINSNISNDQFKITPKTELINYFNSFIDNKFVYLSINFKNNSPLIDLENITNDFKIEYPKVSNLLNDFNKIHKAILNYKDKQFEINFDISLSANIWIAKESFSKDETFSKKGFINKIIDFSNINNYDSIVFDPEKYIDSKFTKNIQIGEMLRSSFLKKSPLITKNEQVKVYYVKAPFEVILNSVSMQDCFENEKIKVKLTNSKELIGILRYKDGVKYVEI
jgi:flagella basal body P-ring formation protein FlgA